MSDRLCGPPTFSPSRLFFHCPQLFSPPTLSWQFGALSRCRHSSPGRLRNERQGKRSGGGEKSRHRRFMFQQLHLPFPPVQGGLGRKASTNSGCRFHFSIFFFCHLYRARPGHPLPWLLLQFLLLCICRRGITAATAGPISKIHTARKTFGLRRPNAEHLPLLASSVIWVQLFHLHVRRPVLSHHPLPSTPPPPPPSSPTHLMWHFVARAEAAVSTVILIFK